MSNNLNKIPPLHTTFTKSSFLSTTPIINNIEAVKECLLYGQVQLRIAAVYEAIKYGDLGLDLLLMALQDQSAQVQWAAYSILLEQQQTKAKLALSQYTWDISKLLELYAYRKTEFYPS